jgi:hypothetical protein
VPGALCVETYIRCPEHPLRKHLKFCPRTSNKLQCDMDILVQKDIF